MAVPMRLEVARRPRVVLVHAAREVAHHMTLRRSTHLVATSI